MYFIHLSLLFPFTHSEAIDIALIESLLRANNHTSLPSATILTTPLRSPGGHEINIFLSIVFEPCANACFELISQNQQYPECPEQNHL